MHINSSHLAITVHEENRQTDSKHVKLQEKGTDYIKTPLMVH